MEEHNYLRWLASETRTTWWHDSGDPDEINNALSNGAAGVTTNPVLTCKALKTHPEKWKRVLSNLPAQGKAEFIVRSVVQKAAELLRPYYIQTEKAEGYVCAQVNPLIADDGDSMLQMARNFNNWAPNIAVKLPVTAAGLDVLEECAALGITVTATVSFTVPQVIAVAERYKKGLIRAQSAEIESGRWFAVIMIGRIDDYLLDIVKNGMTDVSIEDIKKAGIAITKRAYSIFKERNYKTTLMIAALRGTYHMEELAGADLVMSIHPKYQEMLLQPGVLRDPQRISVPVSPDVIRRLETIPEFVRAYNPQGMIPDEFLMFGANQRTLSQFIEQGWSLLESFASL